MPNVALFFFLYLFLNCNNVQAQKDFVFSGYLSELPSITWSNQENESGFNNVIHNRVNFVYYNSKKWTTEISVRNRLIYGQLIDTYANFPYLIGNDEGYIDMSFNWGERGSYVLNTCFDRFSLNYVKKNFQLKFGRQRINWGQNMIWNPNDIFNTYSYFDFDYPERSGADALRMEYYTGAASLWDAAIKIDRYSHITAALRYKFNVKGYDVQFLAGELNQEDFIIGTGWNGHIGGAGFYGEITYLNSYSDADDYDGVIGAIGGNYSFKKGGTVMAEWLYMSHANSIDGLYSSLYYNPASIKDLSIGNHSYLLSATYPVTPLLTISMSYVGFGFPVFRDFYLGPNIDYSISDKLSASAFMQNFMVANQGVDYNNTTLYFRLKYNF